MGHLSRLWEAFVVFGPMFIVLFGITTGFLFFGFTKYHECPFEPRLPEGLLGFGLMSLICGIIALILVVVSAFKVDDSGTHLSYLLYAFIVVVVYGIATTILASAVAYLLYTKYAEYQSENPNDPETFCHASVTHFSFGFVAIAFGFVVILINWLVRYFSNKKKRINTSKKTYQHSTPNKQCISGNIFNLLII